MMAPVFFLLLGAVSVFAVPHDQDLVQYRDYDYADRIIGGFPAGIEELPYLVGLLYTRRSAGTIIKNALCGGTILTNYWVLTSGFCAGRYMRLTSGVKVRLTHIRAGSSYNNRGGVLRRVIRRLTHEGRQHDIGLVKVDKPWPLNGVTISVGRLPLQGDPIPVGSVATIMGWGSIDQHGTPADILRKEEVLVISGEACNSRLSTWMNYKYGVSNRRICTISDPMKKPSSVYRNDPGGPVVVDDEVVGVVAWFHDEKPAFVPNVHTRVSSYIEWIEDYVGPLPRIK